MAQKLDVPSAQTSWEDVAYSNMIQTEALAQLLVEKGILTKDEFSRKVEEIHATFMAQQPHPGQSEA
ncbi:hypothetical protein [Desulfohalobium retbaense]|uniref:SHOCT domain-containing protein n=1 Tax=Desulfohalobium retbaense (strain ATCC 49708 / DSM 5692 / JCM 16813 / HR100) TaxID=485915 RepID=C8X3B6_DESRD|nr:hypothetical protein [Desulfohalobium retbaense]ACV68913.1 hypothetical protein Dret_1629 [Desulfohalobium retbaense DSM 5692]